MFISKFLLGSKILILEDRIVHRDNDSPAECRSNQLNQEFNASQLIFD